MATLKVNNLPDYASNYPFIVVMLVNGEIWYYGSYSELSRALYVAQEVHGMVVPTEPITIVKGEY